MATDVQVAETPAEKRRLQQRREARRAILEAAEDLLVHDGYEGFSMRRLADRCGYTAPTIYHYFGDKSGLLDAMLENHFAGLLERVELVPQSADPLVTLRAQLGVFLAFCLENPNLYRLLEVRRPEGTEPVTAAERARERMEKPLVELIEAGRLRTDDLELAVQTIWMTLHGILAMQINRPDHDWAPNLGDFAFETLLRGLCKSVENDAGRSRS